MTTYEGPAFDSPSPKDIHGPERAARLDGWQNIRASNREMRRAPLKDKLHGDEARFDCAHSVIRKDRR